ncbi:alpha/beta hydrolase [Cytobacillus sp. OWB-43]|uniref:alpha/beta fold hydrolase n=1 Tax=Cytobacillus sp. OWB-43 TaxID=3108468 RepID=UPI002AFF3714|nr:alpha/beta hydrolase [Cytobacillus sp. OWB-43]MEA1852426.1 alpha/beta hydrolase [Cytobacillus sp. OWB-43]
MTLKYTEHGDKSASLIVFLHGGGVSGWMWDKQIQPFSNYYCIVPDLPEHGLHSDDIKFTIKGSAELVINLLEQKANGKKIILIGFSLGAQVIIQILSMKPYLIDFAIINSALVRPYPYTEKLIKTTVKWSFPLIKHKYFSKIQAKILYVNEAYFDKYYEESARMKIETLMRVLQENMSFRIPKEFKMAKTKILVTVGEKEKAVMKKSATDIVASHLNCQGVTLLKIGHGFPLAKPDLFTYIVETWLLKGDLPNECSEIRSFCTEYGAED